MSKQNANSFGREFAFKFLCAGQFKDIYALSSEELALEIDMFYETYSYPDAEHPNNDLSLKSLTFGKSLIQGLRESYQGVDSVLQSNIVSKDLSKIDTLERNLLLLGAYELSFMAKIAPAIVINEYILLAKKYGQQSSHTLLNAILDKISKNK